MSLWLNKYYFLPSAYIQKNLQFLIKVNILRMEWKTRQISKCLVQRVKTLTGYPSHSIPYEIHSQARCYI